MGMKSTTRISPHRERRHRSRLAPARAPAQLTTRRPQRLYGFSSPLFGVITISPVIQTVLGEYDRQGVVDKDIDEGGNMTSSVEKILEKEHSNKDVKEGAAPSP